MDTEDASEFYRLWSALQFMFCMPDEQEDAAGAADTAEYGDGFSIAGCVFIHLVGQQRRFEVLDFAYHVLRVHECDLVDASGGEAAVGMVDEEIQRRADTFIHRAALLRQTNRSVRINSHPTEIAAGRGTSMN